MIQPTDGVKALKEVVVLTVGFNPTRSTSPCYNTTHACNNTYTKMKLSTVKWAQWDKTQSGELLGPFICVCISLCTIVVHNIAQNRPDNVPSYPLDNHHCSDDVYLREGGHVMSQTPCFLTHKTGLCDIQQYQWLGHCCTLHSTLLLNHKWTPQCVCTLHKSLHCCEFDGRCFTNMSTKNGIN